MFKKYYQDLKRRGEIAATLTIVSFVIILIGTILGTQQSIQKPIQSLLSRAQQSSECDYDSISQVRINDSSVATGLEGFKWVSEGYGDLLPMTEGFYPKEKLETIWQPRPLPEIYRNKMAKTTLFIPEDSEYEVDKIFCENDDNWICGFLKPSNGNKTIGNILVKCDRKVTYGWILRRKTSITPTNTFPGVTEYQPTVTQSPVTPTIIDNTPIPTNRFVTPSFSPTISIRQPTTNVTQNPTGATSCTYNTTIQVKKVTTDDREVIMPLSENITSVNFGASNNKQSQVSPEGRFGTSKINGILTRISNNAEYIFKDDTYTFLPEDNRALFHKGETSSVSLIGLDTTKWKIKKVFCTGVGCPSHMNDFSPTSVISNFIVNCGINITYGWVVEEIPKPTEATDVITCGQPTVFSGERGTFTKLANLGNDTGNVSLIYDTAGVPDSIKIEYNNETVIDTGFRGKQQYNNMLVDLGFPACRPDQIEQDPREPRAIAVDSRVCGSQIGSKSFMKTLNVPNAVITVNAPLENTLWSLCISCPNQECNKETLWNKFNRADIDRNKTVNSIDYILLIKDKNYGTNNDIGDSRVDVNHDGKINAGDASLVISQFGKKS